MKQIITLVTTLLLLIVIPVHASSPFPYKAEIKGEMPETLQNILKQKNKKQNYDAYLHQLLLLGDVIYGTELNNYVDKVADNLLQNDPEVRNNIEIYIVRNNTVNAMMSEKGIMLINVGLLAQISNEAELAFIMAHEFAHYTEKHGWEKKNKKESDPSLANFLAYHNRSREQELEADRIAIERIANSNYSLKSIDGVFDVLLYNNFPYDEVPFTRALVEESFYQFPETYFLDNVAPIVMRENYLDTISTHPNIERRRDACEARTSRLTSSGNYYVQSEDKFKEIQYLARCICLNNDIMSHNYTNSLYNSYVMLHQFPEDKYLQIINAYSFYGLAKHKSGAGLSNYMTNFKKVMGEKQQVNYFVGKITNKELTALALRKCFALYEEYPDNTFLRDLSENLIADLVQRYNLSFDKFTDYAMGTSPKVTNTEENTEVKDSLETGQSNKYQNINKKKKNAKSSKSNKLQNVNFMLVDYANNETLEKLFKNTPSKEEQKVLSTLQESNLGEDYGVYILKPYVNLKHIKESKRVASNEKYALRNWKATQRSAKRTKHNIINDNLQVDLIDTKNYISNAKMNDWSIDMSNSIANNMIPFESWGITNYIDTKNNYIVLTGVSTDKEKMTFSKWLTRGSSVSVIATIAYPYVLPAMVAINTIPLTQSVVLFYFIDPTTGKTIYSSKKSYYEVQSNAYIDAFIYDCLYNVKNGGKK